ncbi:MAG: Mpo1-like protein [Acetobacteraceae bacterium]
MTYDQFWLRYLRAHARPATRALHYVGTLLAIACLAGGIAWDWRLLPAAPILGYGFAWTAHFGIEGNRPETFGHPFWSLASDFRLLVLFLSGRLAAHLRRAETGAAQSVG